MAVKLIINLKAFLSLLLVLILTIYLNRCTSHEQATLALTNAGYTNIQIIGYRNLHCGENSKIYVFHTGFKATTPSGKQVSGVVCSGILFLRTEIRLD